MDKFFKPENYGQMDYHDKRKYDKIKELEVKNKELEHQAKQYEHKLKEHYYKMELDPEYRKQYNKKTKRFKKSRFKKWLEFMFPFLED